MTWPQIIHQTVLLAATLAIVLVPPAFLAGAFALVRRVWGRSFWLGVSAGATSVLFPFALMLAVVDLSTALLTVASLASLVLTALGTRWAFDDWLRKRPVSGKPLEWPSWISRRAGAAALETDQS